MTNPGFEGLSGALSQGAALTSPTPATAPIGDGAAGYLNISPNGAPEMYTLVYAPEVKIIIAHRGVEYDVSNDIVGWSLRRAEDSVASLVFRCTNKTVDSNPKNLRYNQLFDRMDKITVWAKRTNWIQLMTGFLDSVPHVQLYPGTVNFRASCTLKRAMHTWWDPGLLSAADIFDQSNSSFIGGVEQMDAGLGTLLRRVLVNVGRWRPDQVHVQRFPMGYYRFMEQQMTSMASANKKHVESFRELLLGSGDTSGGTGRAAGRQTDITRGSYPVGPTAILERQLQVIAAVDEMGMGPDTRDMAASQGLQQAATGGADYRDRPAWQAQEELGRNWNESAMKSDAAIHCFMTVMVESPGWLMYANNAVPESLTFPHDAIGSDHDSVGLFQQRPGWGSVADRMNPRASAIMFLQKLNTMDWRNADRGTMCQAVQVSAFPEKYKLMEQAAIEAVRALRLGNMPDGVDGSVTNSLGPGATAIGVNPAPINPGSALTTGTSIATQNGTPSLAGTGELIGRPKFDTQGAINFAMTRIGTPYEWGGTGPLTYDCSGFTQACYRSIGIDIGRNTTVQKTRGVAVTPETAVPGDLIFPVENDHVVMYLGGGMMIDAAGDGQPVATRPIWFNQRAATWRHYPPAEYGGPGPAPFDPAPLGPGAIPGTVGVGANGGTYQTGASEPIARNLFSYQFEPGMFANSVSQLFGGSMEDREKAFMNDQPLIQTVASFAKAGMRRFQSAPNGDFVAYYPDYFGLDGKDAVLKLRDIEMKNVQIDFNDDALTTHVYVAGSVDGRGAGGDAIQGMLQTMGVATVENMWLLSRMIQAAPRIGGELVASGQDIMLRYGARPFTQSASNIRSGPMEFLLAVQVFMTKWAEQYSTQIELTFMPELFPGMRIELEGHNLQVYVTEVIHSGDYENGFTTTATIMAPSSTVMRSMAAATQYNPDDRLDIDGSASEWFW